MKVRTGIQGSADVTETGDRRILALFEGEASVGLGELHGQGCIGGNLEGNLERTLNLGALWDDFLSDANPKGFVSIEFVGSEQVIHRIPPSSPRGKSKRRPADCHQSSLGLQLRKPGVVAGDDDVAG